MSQFSIVFWVVGGLLAGMLVMLEVGRRVGSARIRRDPQGAHEGTGAIEGAFFALLGLLIAFTFSGATERFNERRHLVIEEANHIATAWLRIELLPESAREPMRELFRDYMDSRLAIYRRVHEGQYPTAELASSQQLQSAIWTLGTGAAHESATPALAALFLNTANDMFDITTTRSAAALIHPPRIIFVMLIVMALSGSMMAGDAMSRGRTRSWAHIVGFAVLVSFTVYIILDLEYPRMGFIRVDAIDQLLVDLRRSMD
jgi:hypothetical protein